MNVLTTCQDGLQVLLCTSTRTLLWGMEEWSECDCKSSPHLSIFPEQHLS